MSGNTSKEIFRYEVAEGVSEYHVMLHVTNPRLTYTEQVDALLEAYHEMLEGDLKGAVAVFKRFFISDAAIRRIICWQFMLNNRVVLYLLSSSLHWMEQK